MTLRDHLRRAAALVAPALCLLAAAPAVAAPGPAPVEAVAAPPTPAPVAGGPALWIVRDADSTVYLFGTMHLLSPATVWLSPRVDAAFDSASALVMEVANPDDRAAVTPLIRQFGLSPDRPLSTLLTADEMTALDVAARTIGSSAAQMEPMRPWLAGIMLSGAPQIRAGLDPETGVERVLRARAVAAGMTVNGLEAPETQIRMFAGFPESGQLTFLRRTLRDFGLPTGEADQVIQAWATGDVAAVAALGVEPMRRESELLYQTLLARRNIDWADQIQTLLKGSGVTFIAVGALHLAGDESVQAVLRARGVTVEAAP